MKLKYSLWKYLCKSLWKYLSKISLLGTYQIIEIFSNLGCVSDNVTTIPVHSCPHHHNPTLQVFTSLSLRSLKWLKNDSVVLKKLSLWFLCVFLSFIVHSMGQVYLFKKMYDSLCNRYQIIRKPFGLRPMDLSLIMFNRTFIYGLILIDS